MDSTEGKEINSELKIIVIGNSNTGKTSFVNKWTKGTFTDNYKATVVSEFSFKVFQFKDKYYRIQLWDLAGQDKNTHITKIFSKNSHGCIVLCDITNKETFDGLTSWLIEIEKNSSKDVYKLLIGNKNDLEDQRVITKEQGDEFASINGMDFFETSAKTAYQVQEAFEQLTRDIIKIVSKDKQHEELNKSIKLKPGKSNNILTKKKKCCE